MRDIKFRAWDDTAKDIVTWEEILEANDMEKVFSEPDYYGLTAVMQYTGLKDKNGVEIYEGDILTWWVEGLLDGKTGPVYYDEEFACFWMRGVINDFGRGEYVVIGNIYESPELLEASK